MTGGMMSGPPQSTKKYIMRVFLCIVKDHLEPSTFIIFNYGRLLGNLKKNFAYKNYLFIHLFLSKLRPTQFLCVKGYSTLFSKESIVHEIE